MTNSHAFLRKEWMEMLRTKRLLGLGAIFMFFAITSPLMARYMAEIFGMLIPAEDEFLLNLLDDPYWFASFSEYFGQVAQIGVIAIILMFMGTIASEKKSGSADLILTKGISYARFVTSKFVVISSTIIALNLLSVIIVYGYSIVLFDTTGHAHNILLGGLLHSLSLVLVVAITVLCSAFAKSSVISAVFAFIAYMAIALISSLPVIGQYLPGGLMSHALSVTYGDYPYLRYLLASAVGAVVLIVLCLLLAVALLKKRESE